MFINSEMYFCKDFKVEEAKKLYTDFINEKDNGEAKLLFQKICSKMRSRVNDHYISPIRTFLNATRTNANRESYGFIVMGINCILLEFYYEMIYGYDVSNTGGKKVLNAYKDVLPKIDNTITKNLAKRFYKGIRCGIIHQGQTKENTAITFEYDTIIGKNGAYYLCNPQTLFNTLENLYKDYWENISKKLYNDSESQNMIEKFHLILEHIN